MNRGIPQKRNSDRLYGILFLAPIFILMACITFIPILSAFRTSLHETSYAQVKEFIGLNNFREVLGSTEGLHSILNSILFVIGSLLIVMPFGVIIGTLLNYKVRGIPVYRTMIIIPWVLSQTVTALLFKWILNGNYGPISYLAMLHTGAKLDVFSNGVQSMILVVLANAWNTLPIVEILTLAALQSIPPEIYEAAMVDGVPRIKVYTAITLPMIKPTLITSLVMQSMEYFNMVTLIYILTAGGPLGSTQTLSIAAFRNGFDFWHLGLASAYSVVIFLLNIMFSLFYIRLMSKGRED
ncbi:sugar ABC transporter permease [uncultured Sphaerochaeta sp.]|uniref:carbohydrate ABC transporter permease n=1 Tax=uncultured Sphaerochaeta sp. TaxID=886478 RepID=UPI002A0A8CFE|nr:sugar ABC transporter permease [uncultured Sphaerochaeta sp.]